VRFGYGLNYMIDLKNVVTVEVEATPARTYDDVNCAEAMIARTERGGVSWRYSTPPFLPRRSDTPTTRQKSRMHSL
jgi:hypothetical protein